MKKQLVSIIIIGLAFVFFVKSPIFTYYTDTYKSTTAYSIVPKEVPEKTQTKDKNGQIIADSYSYFYTFHFITTDGKAQELTYELSGEDVTPLEPGKLVKAQISKKRIITGPRIVKKNNVPEMIKDTLLHD